MLKAKRRFTEHNKLGKPLVLRDTHRAVIEGRTLFPSRVSEPEGRLLKSGHNQRKIGDMVTKGKWAGMAIYTLTLEERKTCPRSCKHWNDCYGNHMHHPKRWQHGNKLELMLRAELKDLSRRHLNGFVVRLHILGDFYSVKYVRRWHNWMHRYKNLHVFGYTAREPDSHIGIALNDIRLQFPDRWWIRWSDGDDHSAISTGESGIVCPVQTGKTSCCATCALCWSMEKPIRFLVH